ncbi:hypothetical protein M422DRAFT_181104, partial [Sphaerobolus stellatus SS14]
LPPGPPRRPIIGNAFQMPRYREWEMYHKWAKEYGEWKILYLDAFGMPIVLLNSRRMTYELFEKRSSIYSDRKTMPMTDGFE